MRPRKGRGAPGELILTTRRIVVNGDRLAITAEATPSPLVCIAIGHVPDQLLAVNDELMEVRGAGFQHVESDFQLFVGVHRRLDHLVVPRVSIDVLRARGVRRYVVLALGQIVAALIVAW